jgi:hypothetical protein
MILTSYLRSRAIEIAVPGTVKYLAPRLPKHPHPAMICSFGFPHESAPGLLRMPPQRITGVHITRLQADGRGKAGTDRDKIMLARSIGTPIVVAPLNDNLGLAITEGVENALSVHTATGLGVWAAGCASRMPALADAVPDHTACVTIVPDPDETGQRHAFALAARLMDRGIAVDVATLTSHMELGA